MNGNLDFCAMTGQMFVDGVIEHFKYAVMQTALIRWPDIHPGALAHTGQTFQFIDFGSVVFFEFRDI